MGKAYFRQEESRALRSLLGGSGLVVATGGGIVTVPENVPALKELGFVVWLTASEEVIWERVSRNRKRPLLHTENPRETVRALLAEAESALRGGGGHEGGHDRPDPRGGGGEDLRGGIRAGLRWTAALRS